MNNLKIEIKKIIQVTLCGCFLIVANFALAQNNFLVINTIAVNPGDCNDAAGCETASEYIEIFNAGIDTLDIGCSAICNGDWCVTLPTGTMLNPGAYIALGSASSPGFDGSKANHIDINNCGGCAWANPESTNTVIGGLSDTGEQIALFDATGEMQSGLYWLGGDTTNTFPLELMVSESSGCPAKSLTLVEPATNDKFTDLNLTEPIDACSIAIKRNGDTTTSCLADGGAVGMGSTALEFNPFNITGCLYTGETINVLLDVKNGEASSAYWTLSCNSEFPDIQVLAVDVFCDKPGTKTIFALVQNKANGYGYQYSEDIEILKGLEGIDGLEDVTICDGESVAFTIPQIAGIDSQLVEVATVADTLTLVEDFSVSLDSLTETTTISVSVTDASNVENCPLSKEFTVTVLDAQSEQCITGIEDNILLTGASISPNPASEFLNLQYALNDNGVTGVQIFKSNGQVVYQKQLQSFAGNNTKTINIQNLSQGIYLLQLISGNKLAHLKFIKE